jgi:hypothetical protein
MKNQELELTAGLFTIEAEERLETIQMSTDVAESCCLDTERAEITAEA